MKINSMGYCQFLDQHFLPWWKKQPLRRRKTLMFMHDNAPSHASTYTRNWIQTHGIKEDQLMEWPPCSPDLNPIENLWSIIKQSVYASGKQYGSKDNLWKAITDAAASVGKDMIKKLTGSVDSRLLSVVAIKGGHVKT